MKNQIDCLKEVLESKRNELVQYIRSLSSQVIVYQMCSRDEAVTLFHALTRTLADVTAALVAIEKGSYGVCVECHEPIALTRLEVIPWAPYCIRCQEVFEHRKQMMSSAAPIWGSGMTAISARDASPQSDETRWQVLVRLNGGENPPQRPARRRQLPDWDPAGLWSICALGGTQTATSDPVDGPANQEKSS